MSYASSILGMAMLLNVQFASMEENAKEKCKNLRSEYKNLRNLPRKLKKKEKKRILLEYQIFSYDPLNHKNYDWS